MTPEVNKVSPMDGVTNQDGGFPRWEVVTGAGLVWFFSSRPCEAEDEAERIRVMHDTMPIAFPLPITVNRVDCLLPNILLKKHQVKPYQRFVGSGEHTDGLALVAQLKASTLAPLDNVTAEIVTNVGKYGAFGPRRFPN
jgi:hypothetical protein